MKAQEIMHKGVKWVCQTRPLRRLRRQCSGMTSVPVGENDRLVGMVTDRDITLRGVTEGKDILSPSLQPETS